MTFDENKYVSLFSCCILVEGAARSIICDLQRNSFITIPNPLLYFTQNISKYKLKEFKELYSNEDWEILKEYMTSLWEQEYIFFTNTPEMFPPIKIEKWDEPSVITNAIIDIGDQYLPDFKKIFIELAQLGCKHIQIRSFLPREISFFEEMLSQLNDLDINTVDLIVHYHQTFISQLEEFLSKYNYITLTIHSTPSTIDKAIHPHHKKHFLHEIITDESCCGCIRPDYFSINIKSFTESQHYNSCLNRKISIDQYGNIKNCPSLKRSFGSVGATSLIEVALYNEQLKELWKVNKDQIRICKECEFRYICTDCRAYLTNEDDIYSKPFKCEYDPYTASGFSGI
jgi:SPASM domain peptide maturase of grasp-with-spasm system